MKDIDFQKLSFAMAEYAATYSDHTVANALCNTAEKISSIGKPFAAKMTKIDQMVVRFFVKETSYEF